MWIILSSLALPPPKCSPKYLFTLQVNFLLSAAHNYSDCALCSNASCLLTDGGLKLLSGHGVTPCLHKRHSMSSIFDAAAM